MTRHASASIYHHTIHFRSSDHFSIVVMQMFTLTTHLWYSALWYMNDKSRKLKKINNKNKINNKEKIRKCVKFVEF